MEKSAELERSSDFDIKYGKWESDFTFRFRGKKNPDLFSFVSARSQGSARATVPGEFIDLKEKFSCSYPRGES